MNHNSLTKLGQLKDISKGSIFLRYVERFGGLRLSYSLFSIYEPAPITRSPVMSTFQSFIFLKG